MNTCCTDGCIPRSGNRMTRVLPRTSSISIGIPCPSRRGRYVHDMLLYLTYLIRYQAVEKEARDKNDKLKVCLRYIIRFTVSISHRFRPLRRKSGRVNRRERCVAAIFSSITHDIYTMPLFHRPGLGTSGAGVSRAGQGYDRNSLYY